MILSSQVRCIRCCVGTGKAPGISLCRPAYLIPATFRRQPTNLHFACGTIAWKRAILLGEDPKAYGNKINKTFLLRSTSRTMIAQRTGVPRAPGNKFPVHNLAQQPTYMVAVLEAKLAVRSSGGRVPGLAQRLTQEIYFVLRWIVAAFVHVHPATFRTTSSMAQYHAPSWSKS
jgi:hypothetical protein